MPNPFNTYGGGGSVQGPGRPPASSLFALIQQMMQGGAGVGSMQQGAYDPLSNFPIGPVSGVDWAWPDVEPGHGPNAGGVGGLGAPNVLGAEDIGIGGGQPDILGDVDVPEPAAAAAAQGFWPSVKLILGHAGWTAAKLARLESFYGQLPNSRWRVPKEAADMLQYAHFLDDLGYQEEAEQMVTQILSLGFRAKSANILGMFSPLLQQWGLSYNHGQQPANPYQLPGKKNNNAYLQQLLAAMGGG